MDYNMESVLMTYGNPESLTIRRWYRRRYRKGVSLSIMNRTWVTMDAVALYSNLQREQYLEPVWMLNAYPESDF